MQSLDHTARAIEFVRPCYVGQGVARLTGSGNFRPNLVTTHAMARLPGRTSARVCVRAHVGVLFLLLVMFFCVRSMLKWVALCDE